MIAMARPDIDDGWIRYAHELDAALACADFSKGARIVLQHVFTQVFGPGKLKTARVSATELATALGSHKAHFVRAVRELTESGVLVRVADGFRFNKDYPSWHAFNRGQNRPAEPRFTP